MASSGNALLMRCHFGRFGDDTVTDKTHGHCRVARQHAEAGGQHPGRDAAPWQRRPGRSSLRRGSRFVPCFAHCNPAHPVILGGTDGSRSRAPSEWVVGSSALHKAACILAATSRGLEPTQAAGEHCCLLRIAAQQAA
jgi:hypothetical protein